MKKIIVSLIIFISLINIYKLKANSDNWIVNEETEVITNKNYNNVISFDDSPKLLVFTTLTNIYICFNNEEKLIIEGIYFTSEISIDNNKLYLATSLYLYIIDLDDYTYEKQIHNLHEVNDILINNNLNIYLIGSKNNDACILEITNDSMLEYNYGGDNYESFTKAKYIDDRLYLVGLKQAHSNNSPFLNVGNFDDMKSFITIIDINKEILDTYYFNQLTNYEKITSFNIYNQELYLILETSNMAYQYKLSKDLGLLELYQINEHYEKIYELISFNKKQQKIHMYLKEDHDELSILIYQNKNRLASKKLKTRGIIKNLNLIDGMLYIYVLTNSGLMKINIYEYINNANDELSINRINNNYNDTHHIKIDSYFEDLVFQIKTSTPYFQPNINGEYNVTYIANRMSAPSIETMSRVIVEPYVNIINNGIYPQNINLLFFGNGYLNDQKITTGQEIKEPGHYSLKIINANNKIDIYQFDVIENYYKKVTNTYIPSIIEINNGDEYHINYNINKRIENFNINKDVYYNFEQEENVTLVIKSNQTNQIDHYYISSVNYYENNKLNEYFLNESLLIRTLKNKPVMTISEIKEDQNFNINLNISDDDQTLSYLKLEVYDENKIIETKYHYFKNEIIRFNNITINKPYDVKISLVYELGGNSFYEEEIAKLNLTFKKYHQDNISIDSIITDNTIESIKIKVLNDKIEFNEILLGTKNLTEKYQNNQNYLIILISIIVSFLIILITIIISIFKRKKIMIRNS